MAPAAAGLRRIPLHRDDDDERQVLPAVAGQRLISIRRDDEQQVLPAVPPVKFNVHRVEMR